MKHTKLLSLILAIALVFSFASSVMATQEGTTGGSITIDNAVVGQTYNAYQILYIESYNATSGAYAYKANSAWENWLKTQTTYVSFDSQGYVTWVKGADAAAFAKAAQAYVTTNKLSADVTEEAKSTEVKFEDLKLGYYLIDTTLGTLCSLDTTNPSVTIKEKNGVPTAEKGVKEDSTEKFGKTNDADIGQTVEFQATITAQAGAENYVLHDKMSKGLTFGNVTGVTLNDETVGDKNYIIKTSGLDDDCTFEIVFIQDFCDTLKANDKIVVSYTATLNENAVVGLDGNKNEIVLEYGDKNQSTKTTTSETITYTWDLDILKYANGDESKVLQGAQFILLNSDKTKVATVVNGKLTGWADVPAAGENGSITWPANTVLTTNEQGKIEIDGLDADTYYLRETKAPDGYNKLDKDKEVKITGATKGESETLTYTTVVAKVNNQSGTELPSTGGMGTKMFYVFGSILVLGALVLLVVRRRMRTEK